MSAQPEASSFQNTLALSIERRGPPWPGAAWDRRVLAAITAVPRHVFVPGLDLRTAYRDAPHAIGCGQTISQPTVVAIMAQALELEPHHRVLEVGTGSGYHAAVIARLAGQVHSVEIHPELVAHARAALAAAGVTNVDVRVGDGYQGIAEHAPFDRILLTAAPEWVPDELFRQLAEGGVLVAPVGEEGVLQRLVRYRKTHGKLTSEDLGGVFFVPMVRG